MVETKWRAVIGAPAGEIAPELAVAQIRISPMASKPEKALLAAITADDLDTMQSMAGAGSDLAAPASLLLGLRIASDDPVLAANLLQSALGGGRAPWDHKFLRRYLPTLCVCTLLAPGVPAILGADEESTTLLLAEMLGAQGRHLDTVTLLTARPLTPVIGLALAATYLVIGQNEAVVKLTDGLENLDDVTALCLVARAVALRASGRNDEALLALDSAVREPARHPGMVTAALEERIALLSAMGDELAAQADRARIVAIEGGAEVEVHLPHEEPDIPAPPTEPTDEEALAAARVRVRRHIAMTGKPGTFGGRHHRTYQPEVEAMLAAGQFDAAESLMLGLIDAVEDEAEVDRTAIDPTFYLTLADLYLHRGDQAEYVAVMERFQAAGEIYGTISDAEDLAEAVRSIEGAPDQHPPHAYEEPVARAEQPVA